MRTQLYIDGQWVDGNGTLDVIDPSDGSVIAKVATAGDAEMEAALAAADRAADLLIVCEIIHNDRVSALNLLAALVHYNRAHKYMLRVKVHRLRKCQAIFCGLFDIVYHSAN